jgi:hypothetical protein
MRKEVSFQLYAPRHSGVRRSHDSLAFRRIDAVRYPSAAGDVRLFRITCTFVKRQDQWQAIAEQLAALAPNP